MKNIPLITALGFTLGITGCEPAPEQTKESTPTPTPAIVFADEKSIKKATKTLFNTQEKTLKKLTEDSEILNKNIQDFLKTPTEETLKNAQSAWQTIALTYREFFLAKQIAISEPTLFPELNKADFKVDSYPIQPGFIDAFGDYKFSGVVYDVGFPINEDNLYNHHGITDVSEAIIGIYAIDFMLNGIDQNKNIQDYKNLEEINAKNKEKGFKNTEELPQNRRRELLKKQSEILVKDIQNLKNLWAGSAEPNTKTTWKNLSLSTKEQILNNALKLSLIEILQEITEFSSPDIEQADSLDKISPTIESLTTEQKYNYIKNALTSLEPALLIYPISKQETLKTHITTAIKQLSTTENNETWKITFTEIKQALAQLKAPSTQK